MSQRNLCAIVYETRHNYYQVRIAHSVGRYKRTVKFDVIAPHVEAVLGQKEYAKVRPCFFESACVVDQPINLACADARAHARRRRRR
jgi:hypothetical protein